MKNLLFLLLLTPFLVFSQDAKDPGLFEVMYLKIKSGQEKAFEAAVKKHNAAHHKEGTLYNASVHYVINGPNGGNYSWVMGPTHFAAMDDRPQDDTHDKDWSEVNKFVESASSASYWQEEAKLTAPGPDVRTSKSLVWIFDIKKGKSDRWEELVAQVKEVYDAKRPGESMYVYWNRFANTKAGEDAAVVFTFNKWGWLDRESNFNKDYEAVHGADSWNYFLEEFNACVEGRVEFLRERVE
ncbi:MAG: hypothetical protein AAGK97_01655 [Bacteroidota bacterium]